MSVTKAMNRRTNYEDSYAPLRTFNNYQPSKAQEFNLQPAKAQNWTFNRQIQKKIISQPSKLPPIASLVYLYFILFNSGRGTRQKIPFLLIKDRVWIPGITIILVSGDSPGREGFPFLCACLTK